MQQLTADLLLVVWIPLNMFRASLCPSSGAYQLQQQSLVYRRNVVVAVLRSVRKLLEVSSTYKYFWALFVNHTLTDTHHLLSYLLNPWSRVLVEKLTGPQLVKKSHAFTNARHLSLSRTGSVQSMPSSHCLKTHLNIIFPSMSGSSEWSFLQVSPPKPCIQLYYPHTCYMPRPSHSSRLDHPKNTVWSAQIVILLII
jgi:hypothetical protein